MTPYAQPNPRLLMTDICPPRPVSRSDTSMRHGAWIVGRCLRCDTETSIRGCRRGRGRRRGRGEDVERRLRKIRERTPDSRTRTDPRIRSDRNDSLPASVRRLGGHAGVGALRGRRVAVQGMLPPVPLLEDARRVVASRRYSDVDRTEIVATSRDERTARTSDYRGYPGGGGTKIAVEFRDGCSARTAESGSTDCRE